MVGASFPSLVGYLQFPLLPRVELKQEEPNGQRNVQVTIEGQKKPSGHYSDGERCSGGEGGQEKSRPAGTQGILTGLALPYLSSLGW